MSSTTNELFAGIRYYVIGSLKEDVSCVCFYFVKLTFLTDDFSYNNFFLLLRCKLNAFINFLSSY